MEEGKYPKGEKAIKNEMRSLIQQCQSKGRSGWSMGLDPKNTNKSIDYLRYLCTTKDSELKETCDSLYTETTQKSWEPYRYARTLQWCNNEPPSLSLLPGSKPSEIRISTAFYGHYIDSFRTTEILRFPKKNYTMIEVEARAIAGQSFAHNKNTYYNNPNNDVMFSPIVSILAQNNIKPYDDIYKDAPYYNTYKPLLFKLYIINAMTFIEEYNRQKKSFKNTLKTYVNNYSPNTPIYNKESLIKFIDGDKKRLYIEVINSENLYNNIYNRFQKYAYPILIGYMISKDSSVRITNKDAPVNVTKSAMNLMLDKGFSYEKGEFDLGTKFVPNFRKIIKNLNKYDDGKYNDKNRFKTLLEDHKAGEITYTYFIFIVAYARKSRGTKWIYWLHDYLYTNKTTDFNNIIDTTTFNKKTYEEATKYYFDYFDKYLPSTRK